MTYSFPCTVTDVFERKLTKHVGGFGKDATFSTNSAGWYVQIDGIFSLYVGVERPMYEVDEAIVLSIRKAK